MGAAATSSRTLNKETAARLDPQAIAEAKERAIRLDPKTRPVDGAMPWMRLRNLDPRRHYVWASERGVQAGEFDVSYYLALAENVNAEARDGYVVEHLKPGGPQLVAGNTSEPGQPVMFRGHVLMSCPKEFKHLLDQVGDDGSSGQRGADALDTLYKKRGAYSDTRRIQTTAGISVERDPRIHNGDSDFVERGEGAERRQNQES